MRGTFLFLLFTITAGAAEPSQIEEPVTFESITGYLHQHPEVRSIDAFLPALPVSYRANFTLMHHSNSLQGATPETPRVIFYGPDARLILAFTGKTDDPNYDSLELIQFRDQRDAFEFHEIRFPENDATKSVEVSAANPPLCLKCHFKDPRPNWEHYSSWPGAFGEDDDQHRYADNPALAKRVADFLKIGETLPRYRHIVDLAKSYESDGFRTSLVHNINLTQRAAQLNFRRVTRLMREAPHYQEYKYAALGAAACGGPLNHFLTHYVQVHVPALERTHVSGGAESELVFFAALGNDTRSWSMDFVAAQPEFTTPGNSYGEFIAILGESDPDLQPFVEVTRSEYAGIPWLHGGIPSGCQGLAAKSRRALAALERSVTPPVRYR